MKINSSLYSLFIFMLSCSYIPVQSQSDSSRRWKFTDLYFHNGFVIWQDAAANIQDFSKLAPISRIIKYDYTGFSSSQYTTSNSMPCINLTAGLQVRNKVRNKAGIFNPNHQFRIGFSYFWDGNINYSVYRYDRKHIDTVSTPLGNLYFDSVRYRRTNMNYSYNQLRLDASYIIRKPISGRWSYRSGIGFTAGFSTFSTVNISYTESQYIEASPNRYGQVFQSGSGLVFPIDIIRTESYRKKSNIGLSVYIPLGIAFKLSRKHVFWKRVQAFIELRPGINLLIIPELRSYTNGYMSNSTGLQVNL
jgi:hypothetical protein